MHNLQHWGESLNWTPIAWLGVFALLLFCVRILTVWFYMRRLGATFGDSPDENDGEVQAKAEALFLSQKQIVPPVVSSLYFLIGLAFIGITLWGLVSTAWWMIILGVLIWFVVHWPFREAMLSWSRFQNTWMVKQDTDALLKGDLSPEQAKAIKKRLGIDRD